MSEMFPIYDGEIPYLTREQMIEVDRAMIEDFKIRLIQMMENAGRNLAQLARQRFMDGYPVGKSVIVLAGTGGNGGGALVCARHLYNYGASVRVLLSKPSDNFRAIPAHQLNILHQMRMPIDQFEGGTEDAVPELIVDGVIGYSLQGPPQGTPAKMIRWANENPAPVLSLDVPSGLDSTTGEAFDPTMRAAATMTLALPKIALKKIGSRAYLGELYLADISVPQLVYEGMGLKLGSIFSRHHIVRLSRD